MYFVKPHLVAASACLVVGLHPALAAPVGATRASALPTNPAPKASTASVDGSGSSKSYTGKGNALTALAPSDKVAPKGSAPVPQANPAKMTGQGNALATTALGNGTAPAVSGIQASATPAPSTGSTAIAKNSTKQTLSTAAPNGNASSTTSPGPAAAGPGNIQAGQSASATGGPNAGNAGSAGSSTPGTPSGTATGGATAGNANANAVNSSQSGN